MQYDKTREILFISPVAPRPDGTGIEQRAWSHLEALAQIADVECLLAVTPTQVDRGLHMEAARAVCKRISLLGLRAHWKMRVRNAPGVKLFARVLCLHSPAYTAESSDLERTRREFHDTKFDLVFCFRLRSFCVWEIFRANSALPAPRVFVDFDDIESIAIRREIAYERTRVGFEQSCISRLDALEAAFIESRAQRTADFVSVCSELDRERLKSRGCAAEIVTLPNSCLLPTALSLRAKGPVARLLFVGTMSYAPNCDALFYFCEQIFPLIRLHCRFAVELVAVGRNPGPEVLALAQEPTIKVLADVESVQPYYDDSDLVIAPIRFGGGTRIKILEAMAFQRAVVSTTLGAEGLDLVPGRDVAIADTPEAFAKTCVQLLEDDERRHQLALHGRQRVAAVYDRSRIQQQLISKIVTA